MSPIPQDTKEMLLRVNRMLPPELHAQFGDAVRRRLSGVRFENTMKGTAIGAACGAVLELCQIDKLTGIDDWTEIGAACGAAVGMALDYRAHAKQSGGSRVAEAAVPAEAAGGAGHE